jgi:hypothetical protein
VVKRWLLPLGAALATPPFAAGIVVPTTQTCKPPSIPLTFTLPADWACQGPPPYGKVMAGAKAGGVAPGYVVQLNIYTTKVHTTRPVSDYASDLAATMRQRLAPFAPTLRVTHAVTTVGAAEPAVLVTVRSGATVVHVDYFFIHDGVLYELDFGGGAKWLAKDMRAIKATARSVHFVTTA